MGSLIAKLRAWVRGTRGRALLERARQEAAKPQNRRRLQQLRARLARRG